MYSVLLVDDDPILLLGIKHLIDWKKHGCIIAGTALDGNEAIKKIETLEPDLVLCDIAMPGISGLELLQQAEERFPGVVFIMLTNHEEFEYVRESLHYRAAEYLVKNNLNPETLENALERAIAERENRKKLHRVNEADDLLITQQHREMILNALDQMLHQQTVQDEYLAVLQDEGMASAFAFALIPVNYAVLPENSSLSAGEQEKILDWETEIIERLAASFFPCSLLLPTGTAMTTETAASADSQAETADAAADESDSAAKTLLLFAWNLQPGNWETDSARFRERLIKTSTQITRLGIDVIPSDFFVSYNADKNPAKALQQIKTQHYRSGKGAHSETIQKAIVYILSNLEKRIMLQDVADHVYISPGYLSTLFKREFKQNLMDFINQTKIDRACELIRENKYRINEIASLLGYENAFYFSRVFRRHTGTTPSEYSEMLAQSGR